jgi:hypothetical protein
MLTIGTTLAVSSGYCLVMPMNIKFGRDSDKMEIVNIE